MSQKFCFKWDNQTNIMKELKEFLAIGAMVDVTLACDGLSVQAHKIVLSACSPFFKSLFLVNPCQHPIVILKDIKYTDLQAVLQFMYHGRVNVTEDQLLSFIKTAKTLKVKELEKIEFQDNQSDGELENPFSSDYENQSIGNSPQQSECVSNLESAQHQSVFDENDDEVYVPEIKQEYSEDMSSDAVEGLREVESQDNQSNGDLENPFSQEYENQSNGNSLHQSHCTIDCVSNLESATPQSGFYENNNGVYEPEIVQEYSDNMISNTVKGLGEVESHDNQSNDELGNLSHQLDCVSTPHSVVSKLESATPQSVFDKNNDAVCEPEIIREYSDDVISNTAIMPLQDQNSNVFTPNQESPVAERFQDFTPYFHGQTTSTNSLTRDSCAESTVKLHQNYNDGMASSVSVPSKLKHSDIFTFHNEQSCTSSGAVILQDELTQREPYPSTSSTLNPAEREAHDMYSERRTNQRGMEKDIKDGDKKCSRKKRRIVGEVKTHSFAKCSFKTIDSKELKRHGEKKTFKCNQCDYFSICRASLTRHIALVHVEEHPFACSLCPKKYFSRFCLKKHCIRAHQIGLLKCKECDFSAYKMMIMRKHVANMHEKKEDFVCPLCNYRSPRRRAMNKHLKGHQEENSQTLTVNIKQQNKI